MLKKLLIISFVFLNINLKAEIVKNIEIVGNKRFSSETVKIYGEIEVGKNYSQEDLNRILKNLYDTKFFENVEILFNNNILRISLKEYPIINNIELSGEKSTKIKEAIIDKLKLKNKNSFIQTELNDDINLIEKIYRSFGYNKVKIESKVEFFSENRLNILFIVNKGEKSHIKKINFIGDKKIRDNRLYSIIASEEHKFWKVLSKNTNFNEANVELDKRLLINYYKSIGFYDVQVLSSNVEFNDSGYNLTYSINAGNRYKIKKISTNVDNVIDKKLFEPLNEFYIDLVGEYYSPFKIKKLLDEVDQLIIANDLQFIEHSVSETLSENSIDITLNIYEGKKEIVEKINIYGNNITQEEVIRSELLIDEGDPYNKLKLDKSISQLKSRNIFGEVKTEIKQGTKKDQKILDILVEEKPTGEISAGAGIGTNGGSFAFQIKENNWLGKGIKVSTSLDLSLETLQGSLNVTNPNYNFSGNDLNYFLVTEKNDKTNSGYQNNIYTTGASISFEQYRDIYLNPGISFTYDDLQVNDTASNNLKKQKGSFSDLSFDYSIINDKRDRVYGPTEGYLTVFSQAYPIFADVPFIKNSFRLSKYKTLTPDIIGVFKFNAASINGLNNKDVRLSKRLSLGSSQLRGFEYGKIGPKDGNDFIGGNYTASSSLELNLPNLLPESSKIDIGLFLDAGNVWHVDYEDSIDDSNKLRSTVGVNTNWQSPVGPMSFIFSQNLSKASTDITESFNFRLGTTF